MSQRILHLLLIAGLLAAGLAAPAPAAAQSSADIIALVNDLRASLGLPALSVNGSLMAAAQNHATWMAANRAFSHTGEGGSSPQQRATNAGYVGYVAENIVGGTNMSPRQGVVWWENSGIHYQTMTSNRHIHVGAGFANAGGQNIYVLVVGAPSNYAPSAGASRAVQAAAPVIVIPVTRAEPREDGAIVHEIQMGQTAWDIAAVYEVELDLLLRLNNLPDDPIVFPGDEIYVRPPDGATLPPPGPETHTVQEGQSAWSIAARYNLTLDELLNLNGLPPGVILQPGEQIVIRLAPGQEPPPTRTPTPMPTTHQVQPGDSLWSIAIRYDLEIDELLALNDLVMESVIVPGQELTIRRVEPTLTPSETPRPSPTATPSATATATAAGALAPAVTAVSSPTASPSVTPSPSATPSPTLTPTPTPAPARLSQRLSTALIGVIVIGLGVLVLIGMLGVELYERLGR